MSKSVVRNHNLRREIAEYILNCSDDELLEVISTLEMASSIPYFFSCEKCQELFGECDESSLSGAITGGCIDKIHKYEEMRDDE